MTILPWGRVVQRDFQAWISATDRRKFCRIRIFAKGKLFATNQGREIDCVVITLSAGGAGIRCERPPQPRSHVALYVSGFGRFEGMTTKLTKDGIGVRFAYTPLKRQRITQQLMAFVEKGLATDLPRFGQDEKSRRVSDRSLRGIDEIEITPEMLNAGEAAALACCDTSPLPPNVLRAVYLAMAGLDRRALDSEAKSKDAFMADPRKVRVGA